MSKGRWGCNLPRYSVRYLLATLSVETWDKVDRARGLACGPGYDVSIGEEIADFQTRRANIYRSPANKSATRLTDAVIDIDLDCRIIADGERRARCRDNHFLFAATLLDPFLGRGVQEMQLAMLREGFS